MIRLLIFVVIFPFVVGCSASSDEAKQVDLVDDKVDSLQLVHAEVYESIVMLQISVDQEINSLEKRDKATGHRILESRALSPLRKIESVLEVLKATFDSADYRALSATLVLDSTATATPFARIRTRADLQRLKADLQRHADTIIDEWAFGPLASEARVYTREPYREFFEKHNRFYNMYIQLIDRNIDSLSI